MPRLTKNKRDLAITCLSDCTNGCSEPPIGHSNATGALSPHNRLHSGRPRVTEPRQDPLIVDQHQQDGFNRAIDTARQTAGIRQRRISNDRVKMFLSDKVIAVFGADTPVGAVVAHALSKICKSVRAVPLGGDVLIPVGVDINLVDVRNAVDIGRVLRGVYGCFIYTHSNFRYEDFMFKEQEASYNIAEACRKTLVPHIIYCTQQHTGDKEGVHARHMVVKAEMENHFRAQQVPTTYLELPGFYEDIFGSLGPTLEGGGENCKFKLEWPYLDGRPAELPMVSLEDIGPVIETIFSNPKHFIGDYVQLIGDLVTGEQIAKQMNGEVKGVEFREVPVDLPHHQYQDMCRNYYCPWNNDIANMYKFFCRRAYVDMPKYESSMAISRKLNPAIVTLAQWVKKNKPDLQIVLQTIDKPERMVWWLALVYYPQNHPKFEYYH